MDSPPPARSLDRPAIRIAIVGLCCAAFITLGLTSAARKSFTTDEYPHITAGYSYWKTGSFRLNPEHPPLAKLVGSVGLLPLGPAFDPTWPAFERATVDKTAQFGVAEAFFYNSPENAQPERHREILFAARAPMVFLGALLVIYMFLLGRLAFGPPAGVLAAVLTAFAPTILAHARLVTTDVALTTFWVAATYHAIRYLRAPSWSQLVACSVATGCALASKFSGVLVPGVIGLVTLVSVFGTTGPWGARPGNGETGQRLVAWALKMATYVAIALATVMLTYFVADGGRWFAGFDKVWVNHDPRYRGYFLGETGNYFLTYFAVALLVKLPLGTLALAALGGLWLRRDGTPLPWTERLLLVLPGALIFAVSTFAGKYLGVRYVMPCIPLLILLASRVATLPWCRRLPGALVPIVGAAAVVGSTLLAWPNYIPYFNEAVGGSRGGAGLLDDSNIDWGQDWVEVSEYQREHGIDSFGYWAHNRLDPQKLYGVVGHTIEEEEFYLPRTGWYAVGAHTLARDHLYSYSRRLGLDWRTTYEPVTILGGSTWVFRFWIDDRPPPDGFVGEARTLKQWREEAVERLRRFAAEVPDSVGNRTRILPILRQLDRREEGLALLDETLGAGRRTLESIRAELRAVGTVTRASDPMEIARYSRARERLRDEVFEQFTLAVEASLIDAPDRAADAASLAQAFLALGASPPNDTRGVLRDLRLSAHAHALRHLLGNDAAALGAVRDACSRYNDRTRIGGRQVAPPISVDEVLDAVRKQRSEIAERQPAHRNDGATPK